MEKHPREVGIYQEVRIYQNGTTMVRIVTSKTGYKRRICKKIMTDFFFTMHPPWHSSLNTWEDLHGLKVIIDA